MKWLLLSLLIMCSLPISDRSSVKRSIASIEDHELDRILSQTLEDMSVEAIRIIEESQSIKIGLKGSELRFLIKDILNKIRYTVINPIKATLFRYPDAIVFSTLFRVVKNPIVASALIYSGNAHLIPLVSGILLNADLWTGLYIVARNSLVNIYGKLHYGFTYKKLQSIRDEIFQISDTEFYTFHQIEIDHSIVSVDIKRNLLRDKVKKIRGVLGDQITVPDLEEIVGDKEFVESCLEYKGKPYLYNEMLLTKILSNGESKDALLKKLRPMNMADQNLGLQQFIREVRLFMNGMDTYLIDMNERIGNEIKRVVQGRFPRLDPRVWALKYELWRFRHPVVRELNTLRALEYDLLAQYLKSGNVDLAAFKKNLEEGRRYISRKLELFRQLEEHSKAAKTFDQLRNGLRSHTSSDGSCSYLFSLLRW